MNRRTLIGAVGDSPRTSGKLRNVSYGSMLSKKAKMN